ncbi:MAG: hypothetical protein HYV09_32290 [Deltaproteobacteria bacterium]|nr:hypothetical protein [Deltaproteobacteria bacterium]
MRTTAALLVFTLLSIASCRRSSTTTTIAADDAVAKPPPPVQAGLFDLLPPIPPAAVGLASYRSNAIGLVRYTRANFALPTCFDAEVAKVDVFFQISVRSPVTTIQAAHGKLHRDTFEMCMKEVVERILPEPAKWEREGQLTKVTLGSREPQYLGYAADGWIGWDKERATIEAWLAAKPVPTEALAPLVERGKQVKRAAAVSLFALDISGPVLGIPSRGGFFVIDESVVGQDAAGKPMLATVIYDSPDDAVRAAKAVSAAAVNPSKPEALRKALAATNPTAQGAELVFDVAPFMSNLDAMREATLELAKVPGAALP